MGSVASKYAFPKLPSTFNRYDRDVLNNSRLYVVHPRSGVDVYVAVFCAVANPIFTILFSHGNGETIGTLCYHCACLSQILQARVVVYDYEGYGLSTGKPNESRVCDDAVAVWEFIVSSPEYLKTNSPGSDKILLWGRSIGSVPTCYLGQNIRQRSRYERLRGIILQCPISSALNIVCNLKCNCCGDCFKNYKRIQHFTVPTLLIHGTRDSIAKPRNAETLIRYAKKCNRYYIINFLTELAILQNPETINSAKILATENGDLIGKRVVMKNGKLKPVLRYFWLDGADHNNMETAYKRVFFTVIATFSLIALNEKMDEYDEGKQDREGGTNSYNSITSGPTNIGNSNANVNNNTNINNITNGSISNTSTNISNSINSSNINGNSSISSNISNISNNNGNNNYCKSRHTQILRKKEQEQQVIEKNDLQMLSGMNSRTQQLTLDTLIALQPDNLDNTLERKENEKNTVVKLIGKGDDECVRKGSNLESLSSSENEKMDICRIEQINPN